MDSRRNFIGKVATGLAGTLAATAERAGRQRPHSHRHHRPGRPRQELMREAIACPNTEFVASADVYTRRLEDAKRLAPTTKTYLRLPPPAR